MSLTAPRLGSMLCVSIPDSTSMGWARMRYRRAMGVACRLGTVHARTWLETTCFPRRASPEGGPKPTIRPTWARLRTSVRSQVGFCSVGLAVALALVWLVLASCSRQMAATSGIQDSDCCVSGFCVDGDPTQAERSFGRPDSTRRHYNGVCADTLTVWFYRGMSLTWFSNRRLRCMVIDSANYYASRGVRVGDSIQTTVRLLGEPTRGSKDGARTGSASSGPYTYEAPARGREAGPSLILGLEGERIRSIYSGWLCR